MAGYGFKPIRKLDASPYNGAMLSNRVTTTNEVLAHGDVIELNTTGLVDLAAASSIIAHGIAMYFEYTDASGLFHQVNYIAAGTATSSVIVTCFYVPLEGIVFSAIADDDTSALAVEDRGENVNFIVGTSSAVTHQSAAMVDSSTVNTTATLPLQIIGLHETPGNAYGNTAGTVEVEVVFATHSRRAFGSTGSA